MCQTVQRSAPTRFVAVRLARALLWAATSARTYRSERRNASGPFRQRSDLDKARYEVRASMLGTFGLPAGTAAIVSAAGCTSHEDVFGAEREETALRSKTDQISSKEQAIAVATALHHDGPSPVPSCRKKWRTL
jgi:hypothetical protein